MKLHDALVRKASEEHDINYFMFLLYQLTAERAMMASGQFQVIELGVRTGNSTVAFLAGLARAGMGKLLSFDIDPCLGTREEMHSAGLDGYWTFQQQDSLEAARGFSDDSCDIVFIDTSHEAEQTRRELQTWAPKVKTNGLMLLHDTLSRPAGVGLPCLEFHAAHPQWRYCNIRVCCGLGMFERC